MIIGKIETIERDDEISFQCRVSSESGDFTIAFTVGSRWAQYVDCSVHDAFLISALHNAMSVGEDIIVEGLISEKLYYNASNFLVPMQRCVMPHLSACTIQATGLRSTPTRSSGVATGISGGVDSFYSIACHLEDGVPESYRLTHLLYSCHRSKSEEKDSLALARFTSVNRCAENIGLPLIRVDTNHNDFSRIKYQSAHSIQNIASAILLQDLLGKYYYSSGIAYPDCHLEAAGDAAYSDPFVVPLLSTEKLQCIPFGGQAHRTDKTLSVADYPPAREFLNVCVSYTGGAKNCSVCRKCCRTLLTLEIQNKIAAFSNVFDLQKYRAVRSRFIFKVLRNPRDPLNTDIIELAKQAGFRFPRPTALLARIYGAVLPYEFAKACDRGIRRLKWMLPPRPKTPSR